MSDQIDTYLDNVGDLDAPARTSAVFEAIERLLNSISYSEEGPKRTMSAHTARFARAVQTSLAAAHATLSVDPKVPAQLIDEIQSVRAELAEEASRIERLETALVEEGKRRDELSKKSAELNEKLSVRQSAESDLAKAQAKVQMLETEFKALKSQFAGANADFEVKLRADYVDAMDRVASVQSDFLTRLKDFEALLHDAARQIRLHLDDNTEIVGAMTASGAYTDSSIASVVDCLSQIEADMKRAEAMLADMVRAKEQEQAMGLPTAEAQASLIVEDGQVDRSE
ncbi:hypothetical protein [Palleronia caenipelagi]|uniref:Uncharacterized protein n=1 Tax=Palleronia caenipelagi TaxID=2489174 RepID=A0A547PMX1_9RHOB|nr:hypothetical protein [Palleronia caenipelagi]TRD15473.1 hypothetical protein FEV53_16290 [Palleronia caenipelagi]